PQALMNFPSFEYFTTRLFEPWPSADEDVPVGSRHDSGRRPEMTLVVSGSPSVISTCPWGLNLRTKCPALTPALVAVATASSAAASVAQMLPSRSTCNPCGQMNIPAPKLLTTVPLESNL